MTRMGAVGALVLLGLGVAVPHPARADEPTALMGQFFAIWDDDAHVTPATVASLYAPHVSYYGQELTTAQVYANKQAFIRRWPDRRYAVVPGSVSKGCEAGKTRCRVSVVLAYAARNDARNASARGYTRVNMALARENGQFRITRESGSRVARP